MFFVDANAKGGFTIAYALRASEALARAQEMITSGRTGVVVRDENATGLTFDELRLLADEEARQPIA